MKNYPQISIVVPLKEANEYLWECIEHCLALDYPAFELLVFPDALPKSKHSYPNLVKFVPTGPASPAEKRDMALAHCQGEIVAFLDDDAYPTQDWLKNAVQYFKNDQVGAVGGPAITPSHDNLRQRASGMVFVSRLGGGGLAYRYTPMASRNVDDYPTCNLLVRKSTLNALGGFDTRFWPGEDTKLCLEITQKLQQTIIYAPDVVVYHHRRPLFGPHLSQVRSYATHRGYFVKRFPQTSLRLVYFLPSLFVAGLIAGGLASWNWPVLIWPYIMVIGVYLAAALASAKQVAPLKMTPIVAVGIVLTHLIYGLWFVVGLLKPKLSEEIEP